MPRRSRPDETDAEVAATRLRQASGRHSAAFLLVVPLREETAALGELYAAAKAYTHAVDGGERERAIQMVLRTYRSVGHAHSGPEELRAALKRLDDCERGGR